MPINWGLFTIVSIIVVVVAAIFLKPGGQARRSKSGIGGCLFGIFALFAVMALLVWWFGGNRYIYF